jgi:hypothetical protein
MYTLRTVRWKSDILRWSSSSPGSCRDVAGADINFDFPGPKAQIGCETLLVCCHVAQDSHRTEKQIPSPGIDWRTSSSLVAAALQPESLARFPLVNKPGPELRRATLPQATQYLDSD